MWAIVIIIFAGGFVAYVDAPSLVRHKMIKEFVIFVAVLSIGITISILEALRIKLPNPLDWIIAIHRPISKMFGMLE